MSATRKSIAIEEPVRVRRILDGRGSVAAAMTVYCPVQRRSIALVECESCPHCEGVSLEPNDRHVICRLEAEPTRRKLAAPSPADGTPIRSIMSTDVACVTEDVDAEALARLFFERNIGCAPVVDKNGCPVGMVSRSDLLREKVADGDAGMLDARDRRGVELDERDRLHVEPLPASVHELMTPIAFTLDESESIARAAALMSYEGVHHLPVVSASGRVVGVLSALDVARWVAREAGYGP